MLRVVEKPTKENEELRTTLAAFEARYDARIGILIDLRLTATRQALNVLIQSATQQGGLYDQAGHAVYSDHRKPLAAV